MKKLLASFALFAAMLLPAVPVSAHVRLDPSTTVVGRQVYGVRVPNEKEISTTKVRLVVPDGVDITGVLPVAGWTHAEKKMKVESAAAEEMAEGGHDEEAATERITEITWEGGEIKAGEYMVFNFSTNYTGEPKEVTWKAYQTYSDGSVVPWDGSSEEAEAPTVKITAESAADSVKKSVDDLSKEVAAQKDKGFEPDVNTWLAGVALVFAIVTLMLVLKGRQN